MKTHLAFAGSLAALVLSIVTTPDITPVSPQVQTALSADVVLGQEIEGVTSAKTILNLFVIDGPKHLTEPQRDSLLGISSLERLRAGARYVALTTHNADLLLLPTYTIHENDHLVYKEVTVTVKGFKGIRVKPLSGKRLG